MSPPKWFRPPAGLVLTTVLVGCGEGITALPTAKPIDDQVAAALSVAVDDVVDRVLPDLTQYAEPTALAEALALVNTGLSTQASAQLTRGTDMLRVAIDEFKTSEEAASADLDAVRVLLDDVRQAGQAPRRAFISTR